MYKLNVLAENVFIFLKRIFEPREELFPVSKYSSYRERVFFLIEAIILRDGTTFWSRGC